MQVECQSVPDFHNTRCPLKKTWRSWCQVWRRFVRASRKLDVGKKVGHDQFTNAKLSIPKILKSTPKKRGRKRDTMSACGFVGRKNGLKVSSLHIASFPMGSLPKKPQQFKFKLSPPPPPPFPDYFRASKLRGEEVHDRRHY